jgi:Secretin and TonB N terminus short domain
MANRIGVMNVTTLSLAALGFMALPICAIAQNDGTGNADTATNDQLNKPINLDVKSANLYYALTLMFDQLKVGNYTIPEELKQAEVSAHFTQLPLRTALETLLKNRGYTYKVDGGVYSVVPKAEDKPELPIDSGKNEPELTIKGKKIYRLTSNQIIFNSVDIVTRLGGRVLPSSVGSQMSSGGGGLGGGGLGSSGGGLGGGLGGFGGGGLGGGGLGGGLGGFGGGGLGGGGFGGGGLGGGGFGGGGLGGGGGGFGGGGGGRRGGGGF